MGVKNEPTSWRRFEATAKAGVLDPTVVGRETQRDSGCSLSVGAGSLPPDHRARQDG